MKPMIRCIECKKHLKEEVKWCSMKCKRKTWLDNYHNASIVGVWVKEEHEKHLRYLQSPQYRAFVRRINEVGLVQAIREIK